ncbi:MAG: CvpA family protein [Candidatus Eremiobacteraeota bacterium]|jgi:membrane protein required for colicin V production|nr:CvpA family protein [Candidatus Eremiobacteraeota bacterium]
MIGSISWADVFILIIVAFTAARGFERGLIKELAGIVALAAALIVPWFYNGALDGPIASVAHVELPIAHVIATVASGAIAYVIVLLFAALLGRVKKVPVLGFGNAIAGAVVGFFKGATLVWILLYVALFFPLTPPIRASLHASHVATYLMSYNSAIDGSLQATIPGWALSLLQPFFKRHHV